MMGSLKTMDTLSSPQLVRVLGAEPGRHSHSRAQRAQLTSLKTSFCPRLHSTSFTVSKCRHFSCTRAATFPIGPKDAAMASLKLTRAALARTFTTVETYPCHVQCAVAAGLMAFALWGLGPSVQVIRRNIFQRRDWDKSRTKRVITSYLRPLMLWAAAIVLCRALDPVVLSSERSQAIKERFLNFLRSLSTVLTFAFCTARLTQQIQKVMIERQTNEDARNLGIRFIGNAVSTSVWVAAVCLFMELLGFSTQKWLTAGGFGTVLLTLAGREIFTNFLSSVMIHATRPFVECEWIQTKIDGQEVSGTVEHVGWWSPTVIRGEDREAVHIPNHKFTMSVVRNLSQKTHWRIKTHIGISHLDANKINLIVADMRKVLAKHPQVEHRRLHRRVFLDNIDPVNQSLLVMVSCFVKTSHYEEYFSVKEIILLNLLKVISHHNARLATPIRTIQRIYDEVETRQSPFRNVRSEDSIGRPFLLAEASAAAEPTEGHGNGSTKNGSSTFQPDSATTSLRNATTIEGIPSHSTTKKASESHQVLSPEVIPAAKPVLEGLESMGLNSNDISLLGAAFEKPPAKISEGPIDPGLPVDTERVLFKDEFKEQQSTANKGEILSQKAHQTDIGKLKPQKDAHSLHDTKDGKLKPRKDAHPLQEIKDKPQKDAPSLQEMKDGKLKPPKDARPPQEKPPKDTEDSQGDPWRQPAVVSSPNTSPSQRRENAIQDEKPTISKSQSLEDNLVLGLALAGSKRTLPLDDEIMNHLDKEPGTKRNAAATQRTGSGKDTIDRQLNG